MFVCVNPRDYINGRTDKRNNNKFNKMKTYKIFCIVLTFFMHLISLTSCTKQPQANFTINSKMVDKNTILAGEEIEIEVLPDATFKHYKLVFNNLDSLERSENSLIYWRVPKGLKGTLIVKLYVYSKDYKKQSNCKKILTIIN